MTGFCDDRFHDNVTTISYEISNIKCQWFGWDAKVRNGMARSGRAEAPVVGLSFCAALAPCWLVREGGLVRLACGATQVTNRVTPMTQIPRSSVT